MKDIQVRPYQANAINAIQNALESHQKHIVVDMVEGSGIGIILKTTIELLAEILSGNILVVTNRMATKDHIEHDILNSHPCTSFYKDRIIITTEQRILRNKKSDYSQYEFIIFYKMDVSDTVYETLGCFEKRIIIFSNFGSKHTHEFFTPKDIVFSYDYNDAVKDGVLTPAMDEQAFEPAVLAFVSLLLKQFGFIQNESNTQNNSWELVVTNSNSKLFVECKTYKNQVVSASTANSLLNSIVMRKMKENILDNEIVLLIVLSKIPYFDKKDIFKRFKIIVWDIENLVFYSKNDSELLKKLAQITYFPIDYIEGKPSVEASLSQLFIISSDNFVNNVNKEENETIHLIQRLTSCKSGKTHSSEYEEICEEILRYLFEANYFNKLTKQHKTNDEHFRMDLIGALKINQNNDESMHPLWQMLVNHYNSHFVVFEFKNYSKEIDQNLIYITEKYLFDAALRNVAIIISHKGFSDAAKFAAEGCLKEHGKLILSLTNNDLIEMLKLNSDKAADYLLGKLETFLMGISK